MDRAAWQATVHETAELDMTERLTHTHTHKHSVFQKLLNAGQLIAKSQVNDILRS